MPEAGCAVMPVPDTLAADMPPAYYYPPAPDGLASRHLFRQHSRARHPGEVRGGIGRIPRSGPGSPFPGRPGRRDERSPDVPPSRSGDPIRRGVGAIRRASRRRDGPLLHRPRSARHALRRLVARRSAGGRHRDPRPRLDIGRGRSISSPRGARSHLRSSRWRWTATSVCPGKPWPTRWDSWRSAGSAPMPSGGWGADFDISGFHDTVLTSGSVTLEVLGDQVQRWVEAH